MQQVLYRHETVQQAKRTSSTLLGQLMQSGLHLGQQDLGDQVTMELRKMDNQASTGMVVALFAA